MIEMIPPLRPGIHIQQAPVRGQEVPVLQDTALGQRVRLNDEAARVAAALDVPQSLTDLARRLDGDPAQVEAAVTWFRGLQLLDTAEARAFVEHARQTADVAQADPDTVPLLIRDDFRFSCTMCGGCCGGHNIGPVAPDIVEGLRPHAQMLQEKTGSKKGLFFALPSPPDADVERVVCHQSGGSCVFLSDERRCIIHQELGADKKPGVCRLFPYRFVATPEGVEVSLQMECRGFVEARHGKPLAEQEAGLRELLKLAPVTAVRPMIAAEPGRALSWPEYRELEASFHTTVDSASDEAQALLGLRSQLRQAAGRTDGAPDRIAPHELAEDLDALTSEVGESLAALYNIFNQADATHVVSTDALDQLGASLDRLRPDLTRALRPCGHRALFNEMVHHHLAGKELTTASSLSLGLARFTFGWLAARTLMIVRARQVKRVHLVGQDVLDAIVLTHFLLRNTDFLRIFQRHDASIRSLFYERLPWLVEHAPRITGPDRRLELIKF